MGMIKIFPILLVFYHKLVLREDIFATAASLIHYFAIIRSPSYDQVMLCKQPLFQQTSFLFFVFSFCETQNMIKGCEEIFREGKHFHNSRKL